MTALAPIEGVLDPGIRDLVLFLREFGFSTTDSGDGVTKVSDGYPDALQFPHVAMSVPLHYLISEARRLVLEAQAFGLQVEQQGPGVWYVQASYDPCNDSAILFLAGPERDAPQV